MTIFSWDLGFNSGDAKKKEWVKGWCGPILVFITLIINFQHLSIDNYFRISVVLCLWGAGYSFLSTVLHWLASHKSQFVDFLLLNYNNRRLSSYVGTCFEYVLHCWNLQVYLERERERWWYTFMALSFTKHKNWCIRRCELWELYALKLTPFDILLY